MKPKKKKKSKTSVESIVSGDRHEDMEIVERARAVEKPEDAAAVICKYKEVIRSKSKTLSRKFKEREKNYQTYYRIYQTYFGSIMSNSLIL